MISSVIYIDIAMGISETAPEAPAAKSGRFLLRAAPGLHRRLDAEAREAGLSFNEYCVRRLALGAAGRAFAEAPAGLAARGQEVLGDALVGIVLFGSRVRGDARADSDLDVLFAVEDGAPITRGLRRRWDAIAVRAARGPEVDPHFVHLPAEDSPSVLWGEAALEGVVVFERGWRVSEALTAVRRAAAEGRWRRRTAHGQPYWVAG